MRLSLLGFLCFVGCLNSLPNTDQNPNDIGKPPWFYIAEAKIKTQDLRKDVVIKCKPFNECRRLNGYAPNQVCTGSDLCQAEQVGCQEYLNRLAIATANEYTECRTFYNLPELSDTASIYAGPCGTQYMAVQQAWSEYRLSLSAIDHLRQFGITQNTP
jgi:hypothetical protein